MIEITLTDLLLGFIPVAITIFIMLNWALSVRTALLSVVRMLLQLIVIGYALTFIFNTNSPWIISLVLSVMLFAASWISLTSVSQRSWPLFGYSFVAITIGGVFTLFITTQGVLKLDPWYSPQVMIPIAGMIFSNAMTTISLAAERFFSEYERGESYQVARDRAFQAAMIPVFNALLAVGLVSLPGMMTGQILSGVSPLIAARYQIMVMLMVFGSAGIAAALFLVMLKRRVESEPVESE